MTIILASSSPRRQQILKSLTADFRIIKPDTQEIPFHGETPVAFALRAANDKAVCVRNILASDRKGIVISADTIVAIDGHILGKPSDHDDAVRMLSMLSGREHSVITALCIASGSLISTRYETTFVRFRDLSKKLILDYLDSIEFLDKAGSYAFQDGGSVIINETRGSITNVIGFPLRLFFSMCAEMNLMAGLFPAFTAAEEPGQTGIVTSFP